mmetsp:Transcript_14446/g.50243  ORF Transcript_14446/g.50243 Transcript_14446/m.50243 type:complete len:226 (+) Transcript_14446:90-767(+)
MKRRKRGALLHPPPNGLSSLSHMSHAPLHQRLQRVFCDEAHAAPAPTLRVRVVRDHERGANELLDEVDRRAAHEVEAQLVHQHADALARKDGVVGRHVLLCDVEHVLKPAAAAVLDAHAQLQVLTGAFPQLLHAAHRRLRDDEVVEVHVRHRRRRRRAAAGRYSGLRSTRRARKRPRRGRAHRGRHVTHCVAQGGANIRPCASQRPHRRRRARDGKPAATRRRAS